MMFWAIGAMSFAAKQYEVYGKIYDSMLISVLVQFVYVLKFFIWETGEHRDLSPATLIFSIFTSCRWVWWRCLWAMCLT